MSDPFDHDNETPAGDPPSAVNPLSAPGRSPGPSFQVRDRRFWAREQDGEELEAQEADRSEYPTFVEQLKARTEAAEKRLKEKMEALEAEYRESQIRQERELDKRVLNQMVMFLEAFLDLPDHLSRAIAAADSGGSKEDLVKGLTLINAEMENALKRIGCERIDVLSEPFDPNVSEAVGVSPTDDPGLDGVVVEEIQTGYRIGDRLVRPARVMVGRYQEP